MTTSRIHICRGRSCAFPVGGPGMSGLRNGLPFVPTVEGLTSVGQTAVSSPSSGRGKVSRPTAASTSSRA